MEVPAQLGGTGAALGAGEAAAAWLPRSATPPGLSLSASDGSGWQEGVATAAGRHYRACLTCRTSKIRCDGQFPCSRCFRLSLPCQPQFWRKDPYAHLVGSELVFKTVDPRGFAALYIEGFTRVFREGRVDRDRAVWMMRIWAGMSAVVQHDITFGLLAAVARALRISPLELEGPDSVRTDMHPDARRAFLLQRAGMLHAANVALQQTPLFKMHDQGGTAIFMCALRPGRAAHTSNAVFDRLVRRSSEVMGDVLDRKCLPALLFAGIIAPEDRALWLYCMAELLFAKDKEEEEGEGEWTRRSHFLKLFDREGDIRIYIYTVKRMRMQSGETIVLHRLEPAPPSRHLTDRPDNHKVMKTFRQVRPLHPTQAPHDGPTPSGVSSSSDGEEQQPQPPPQPMARGDSSDWGGSASSVASDERQPPPPPQQQQQQPAQPRPAFIPGMVFIPMEGGGPGMAPTPTPAIAAEQGGPAHHAPLPLSSSSPPPPAAPAAAAAAASFPLAPPALKEARSGSGDSGGCTDREGSLGERGAAVPNVDTQRIEAIFELEATRRKHKLGQALVGDPTIGHLERTLRDVAVTVTPGGEAMAARAAVAAIAVDSAAGPAAGGGVVGPSSHATTSSSAASSLSASWRAGSGSGSAGGSSKGRSGKGAGSPVAGPSASASASKGGGGVGGGHKKGQARGQQSQSPSPSPSPAREGEGMAGRPAASVDGVVGSLGAGGRQRSGWAAKEGGGEVSALGAREDEAMLLLSLRMGVGGR